jgi:5-hydroxyisourate hydrolase
MSPITTHVLDVSKGRPASGITVRLSVETGGDWKQLSEKTTDGDGRVKDLLAEGSLAAGTYRLEFVLTEYFRSQNVESFYPAAAITFVVKNPSEHYHVPLLLSPFGQHLSRLTTGSSAILIR